MERKMGIMDQLTVNGAWPARRARPARPVRPARRARRARRVRSARPAHRAHRSPGFTLIELLVVITVIAILAGLVSPMVFRNVGDAKATAARAQIETFGLALDTYYLHNDRYPVTAQGLGALIVAPTAEPAARNWRGPYLKKGVPLDPWGNAYQYVSPGVVNPSTYDLVSYGRDGKLGGAEEDADLTSWANP
jgi:general secretion pathway protein G